MEKIKLKAYTSTLSGDMETPITIFQKFVQNDIGFLLESKEEGKGRYSIIGKNPYAQVKSKGNKVIIQRGGKLEIVDGKALDIIKSFMEKYEVDKDDSIPFVGGAVGTVGYDINRQYESIPNIALDDLTLPDVHQMFVRETIVYDHFHHRIIICVLEEENEDGEKNAKISISKIQQRINSNFNYNMPQKENGKTTCVSNMTKEKYMENVKKAKEYIYEGDIFQVVLSQRWSVNTNEAPFNLYRKLRQVNPSSYMFYLNFGEYQVAGCSPEMLVEVRGDKVFTCPIAGTRKRGASESEDLELAKDLKTDEKELAEHVMLVDLGRNDMGRVAKIGSVKVTKFMDVKYYSHVMHLVSLVEGTKRRQDDMFKVLATFLPAGTLSGAPKIRAMEIIEELEPTKRGIYGGAIGYFGFDGDMDMCIAIRTMIIEDKTVYLQAGAGIVADSDPEKEYEETENKVGALISALTKELK